MLSTQMMPALNLFYPLNEFYDEARLPLPSVTRVEPIEIPEPCRGILVHDLDMTPTLEDTYGGAIDLRVLKHSLRENVFSRQIVLTLRDGGGPVLFGAIKIYLDRFPDKARALVLEMKQPLGTILATTPHNAHWPRCWRFCLPAAISRPWRRVAPEINLGLINALLGARVSRVAGNPPGDLCVQPYCFSLLL